MIYKKNSELLIINFVSKSTPLKILSKIFLITSIQLLFDIKEFHNSGDSISVSFCKTSISFSRKAGESLIDPYTELESALFDDDRVSISLFINKFFIFELRDFFHYTFNLSFWAI